MNRQKLTLVSDLMNTVKPVVRKLFPLLALSALAATVAHAENTVIGDCPSVQIIHEKYVKNGSFLTNVEGSRWTLIKGNALPGQYDLNRLELTSVEGVIDPKTYLLTSFACHYNNPGNTAAPITLKFELGRAKVTFQEGYSVVTGFAPNMFNDERDGTDYWVTPKEKPNSRICDKNNKRTKGFERRCGGFKITDNTQPNGFWKNVNDGCRNIYKLCGDKQNSYQILFQLLDNADTNFTYCVVWGTFSCTTKSTKIRLPYCRNEADLDKEQRDTGRYKNNALKCTYEIEQFNRLVEGSGTKSGRDYEGWARYQNMCWAGKAWENKLWDPKNGDNCDVNDPAKYKPASWPDYSILN